MASAGTSSNSSNSNRVKKRKLPVKKGPANWPVSAASENFREKEMYYTTIFDESTSMASGHWKIKISP